MLDITWEDNAGCNQELAVNFMLQTQQLIVWDTTSSKRISIAFLENYVTVEQ